MPKKVDAGAVAFMKFFESMGVTFVDEETGEKIDTDKIEKGAE